MGFVKTESNRGVDLTKGLIIRELSGFTCGQCILGDFNATRVLF